MQKDEKNANSVDENDSTAVHNTVGVTTSTEAEDDKPTNVPDDVEDTATENVVTAAATPTQDQAVDGTLDGATTNKKNTDVTSHGSKPPHALSLILLAILALLLIACVSAAFGIDRWSLSTVVLLVIHVLASVVYLTSAIWGVSLLVESVRVLARFDLRKGETPRVVANGLGGTLLGSFGILALTNLTLRTETLFGMGGTGEWVPYWSSMADAGHLVSRVAPTRFAFLGSTTELGMVVWGIIIAAFLGIWMLVRRRRSTDGRFHIPHTAPMARFLAAKRCVDAFACKSCLTVTSADELRRYVGLFSEAWERDVNEAQGKHVEFTMSDEVREMLDGTKPIPSDGVALYGYGYSPNLQVSQAADPKECRRFSEFSFEPGSYAAYHVGHQTGHCAKK